MKRRDNVAGWVCFDARYNEAKGMTPSLVCLFYESFANQLVWLLHTVRDWITKQKSEASKGAAFRAADMCKDLQRFSKFWQFGEAHKGILWIAKGEIKQEQQPARTSIHSIKSNFLIKNFRLRFK